MSSFPTRENGREVKRLGTGPHERRSPRAETRRETRTSRLDCRITVRRTMQRRGVREVRRQKNDGQKEEIDRIGFI